MIAIDMKLLLTSKDKQAFAEAEERAIRKVEAQTYLVETDWYVSRLAETGVEIPDEVRALRASAREVLGEMGLGG